MRFPFGSGGGEKTRRTIDAEAVIKRRVRAKTAFEITRAINHQSGLSAVAGFIWLISCCWAG